MRKKISALALGLCMFLTPIAQAVNTPTVTHNEDNSIVVSYQGTANTQYAIFVVKAGSGLPSSLDADSILYIDQQESDASGSVTFKNMTGADTGFLLRSNQNADVYITGDADGPAKSLYDADSVSGGSYNGGGIYFPGVQVSGSCNALLAGAKIQLGTLNGTKFTPIYDVTAELSADGKKAVFTFPAVSVGTYVLRIEKLGFLTYTKSDTNVEGEMTFAEEYKAYGGDINKDGAINANDLSLIISDFGSNHPENAGSDINTDDAVNALDLSILVSNYGQSDEQISK